MTIPVGRFTAYPFDDVVTPGLDAIDGNNLTLSGSVVQVAGMVNNALQFTATGNGAAINSSMSGMPTSGDISVSFLIKPTESNVGHRDIAILGRDALAEGFYMNFWDNGTPCEFGLQWAGVANVFPANPLILTLNSWQLLTLVFTNSPNMVIKYYLNGVYWGQGTHASPYNLTNMLTVGWFHVFTSFGGIIDEFNMWSRALVASEVLDLYNHYMTTTLTFGAGGTYPTLTAAVAAMGAGNYNLHQVGYTVEPGASSPIVLPGTVLSVLIDSEVPHGGNPNAGYWIDGVTNDCRIWCSGGNITLRDIKFKCPATSWINYGGAVSLTASNTTLWLDRCIIVGGDLGNIDNGNTQTGQNFKATDCKMWGARVGYTVNMWSASCTGQFAIENSTLWNTFQLAAGGIVRNCFIHSTSPFVPDVAIAMYKNRSNQALNDVGWMAGSSGNAGGIVEVNQFASLLDTEDDFLFLKQGDVLYNAGTVPVFVSGDISGLPIPYFGNYPVGCHCFRPVTSIPLFIPKRHFRQFLAPFQGSTAIYGGYTALAGCILVPVTLDVGGGGVAVPTLVFSGIEDRQQYAWNTIIPEIYSRISISVRHFWYNHGTDFIHAFTWTYRFVSHGIGESLVGGGDDQVDNFQIGPIADTIIVSPWVTLPVVGINSNRTPNKYLSIQIERAGDTYGEGRVLGLEIKAPLIQ